LLALCFVMVYLGTRTKLAVLCHHALRAAKRFFGVPDFRSCAIADGIREIMAGRQAPPSGSCAPSAPRPNCSRPACHPPENWGKSSFPHLLMGGSLDEWSCWSALARLLAAAGEQPLVAVDWTEWHSERLEAAARFG
jgi:hypothetical protein